MNFNVDVEKLKKEIAFIDSNDLLDSLKRNADYLFECIADWNDFIERYKDIFKMITEDSWSYMPDDEDFNYEWINEIDKLLTGYGSEKTYHYLMDMFTKNIKGD